MKKIITILTFLLTSLLIAGCTNEISVPLTYSSNKTDINHMPTTNQLNGTQFEFNGLKYTYGAGSYVCGVVDNPEVVETIVVYTEFKNVRVYLSETNLNSYTNLKNIILFNTDIAYFGRNFIIDYVENMYLTDDFSSRTDFVNTHVKNLYYFSMTKSNVYNGELYNLVDSLAAMKVDNYYYNDEMDVFLKDQVTQLNNKQQYNVLGQKIEFNPVDINDCKFNRDTFIIHEALDFNKEILGTTNYPSGSLYLEDLYVYRNITSIDDRTLKINVGDAMGFSWEFNTPHLTAIALNTYSPSCTGFLEEVVVSNISASNGKTYMGSLRNTNAIRYYYMEEYGPVEDYSAPDTINLIYLPEEYLEYFPAITEDSSLMSKVVLYTQEDYDLYQRYQSSNGEIYSVANGTYKIDALEAGRLKATQLGHSIITDIPLDEQLRDYEIEGFYTPKMLVEVSNYADLYIPRNAILNNYLYEVSRYIFKYDNNYSMGTTWSNTSNYDKDSDTSTITVYHKNNDDPDTLYSKEVTVKHIDLPYSAGYLAVDNTMILVSSYQTNCTVEELLDTGLKLIFGETNVYYELSSDITLDTYCFDTNSKLYIEYNQINLYIKVDDIELVEIQEYTYEFLVDDEVYYTETIEQNLIPTKPTDPTKENHIFIGWEVDGQLYNFDYPLNKNQTLIAVFEEEIEAIYYTVTFDSDGGTDVNTQEIKEGELAYYSPLKPLKENYVFQYWSLNGEEFDFNTPITEDITLVAVWEEYTGPPFINTESLSEGYQILNEIYYTEHYSIERVLKTVSDYLLVKDKQKVFLYYSDIKPFITLDNGVITYKAYLNNQLLVEGTIKLYLIENSNLPFIAANNSDFHFTYIFTNVSNVGITMDEVFKVYAGVKTDITYNSSMFKHTTIEAPKASDIMTTLLQNDSLYATTISFNVKYFNSDVIKSDIKIFNTNNLKSVSTNYEGAITGEIYVDEDYVDTSDNLSDYTLTNTILFTENNTPEEALKLASKYMLYHNGKLVTDLDEFNFEFTLESDGLFYVYVYRGEELVVSNVGRMIKVINTKLDFISTYSTVTHIYTLVTLTQPSGFTADDYFEAYVTLFPSIMNFYQDYNLQNLTKETILTNTGIYKWNLTTYSYRTYFIVLENFDTNLDATYEIGVLGEFSFKSLDYAESKTMASTFVEDPEEERNFFEDIIYKIQNNVILQLIVTSISVVLLIGLAYLIFILFRNIYEWFTY